MASLYLPSTSVSGEDASEIVDPTHLVHQCIQDSDCPSTLVCVYNSSAWMNTSNAHFYQHDDIKGSNNYIKLSGKPTHNICGCSTVGGWTGYDCTEFHSSFYFEATWLIISAIVYISIVIIGSYDLLLTLKMKGVIGMMSKTMMALWFNVTAAILCALGRILHIIILYQPSSFVYILNAKKSRFIQIVTWLNNFAFILTMMCILHIGSCWIEVSTNVQKFSVNQNTAIQKRMQKIVLFLEMSLVLTMCVLLISSQFVYAYVAAIPWALSILILCTFGAQKMIQLMNGVLDKGKNVVRDDTINLYRGIATSIRKTAALFVIFLIICILGNLVYVVSQSQQKYGHPGLWDRTSVWGTHCVFAIGGVGLLASALGYLHPRAILAASSRCSKDDSTVPNTNNPGNSISKLNIVNPARYPFKKLNSSSTD